MPARPHALALIIARQSGSPDRPAACPGKARNAEHATDRNPCLWRDARLNDVRPSAEQDRDDELRPYPSEAETESNERPPCIRRPVVRLRPDLHRLIDHRSVRLIGGKLSRLNVGSELRLRLEHRLLELHRQVRISLNRGESRIRRRLPCNGLRNADYLPTTF